MGETPGQHLLSQYEKRRSHRRIGSAIVEFRRIFIQVEQERGQSGEMHIFVATIANAGEAGGVHRHAQRGFRLDLPEIAEVELEMHRIAPGRRRLPVAPGKQ